MPSLKSNEPVSHQPLVQIYPYLMLPLAVLATPLEMALSGSPGQIGFVLMLLPTLMAAFTGSFRSVLLTGILGGIGIIGAAWAALWLSGKGSLNLAQAILPVIWSVLLVGCGVWLGRCLEVWKCRVGHLQGQCEQHERSIYQLRKDSNQVAETAGRERIRRQFEEAQRLDFSRLLLSIQHIGRELSGNLQMSAVYRLITEAAKKLLKAPNPRLFLIDEQTRDLVEHTPGKEGEHFSTNRGMLGWAARNGQIITAEDVAENHELADLRGQDPEPWHACAPLVFDQRVFGVLGIDAIEHNGHEFDRLLYIVTNFSAVAVNNGQMFQRAEDLARQDGLTGLLNHATFQNRLAEMLGEARRSGLPLSVVLADVDHFKQFNDRHGHQAGDFVLRSVAVLWKRLIPQRAIAARYGGEEFVCVFPDADVQEAANHAESLRFALENSELEFEGTALRVTASFGVAAFPLHAEDPANLIREADSSMYAAKGGGRNRICIAQRSNREQYQEIGSPSICQ